MSLHSGRRDIRRRHVVSELLNNWPLYQVNYIVRPRHELLHVQDEFVSVYQHLIL